MTGEGGTVPTQVRDPITLDRLATSGFDPDDYRAAQDKKPRGFRGPCNPACCQVVACGRPYAPGGVCGVCRGEVKKLRAAARTQHGGDPMPLDDPFPPLAGVRPAPESSYHPPGEADEDDGDAEACLVCGQPATTHYPPHDPDGSPSCGSPRCEYQMQAAQDHHDECGSR